MRAIQLIYRQLHLECGLTNDIDEGWDEVIKPYLNPTLFYHNIDHIEEVCIWLLENMTVPDDEHHCGLLWAGLFHDWVDPREKDAESKSARAMLDYLGKNMSDSLPYLVAFKNKTLDIATSAIMSTITHKSDNIFDQWMIDADLMRFICHDDRFAIQIRKEYPNTPDDVFNFHRERILKEYLARDPFFYHMSYLNDTAKENIERQLAEL